MTVILNGTAYTDAQFAALAIPESIKAQILAASDAALGLTAPVTPAAPQRREPTIHELVDALTVALNAVINSGQPFSARTIVSVARRGFPDLNIRGQKGADMVRAALLSDEQVQYADGDSELARDLILTGLSASAQDSIKRGNISVTPTTIQGRATQEYKFLADLNLLTPASTVTALVPTDGGDGQTF